jgi:uncharacterized membrane protein
MAHGKGGMRVKKFVIAELLVILGIAIAILGLVMKRTAKLVDDEYQPKFNPAICYTVTALGGVIVVAGSIVPLAMGKKNRKKE